MERTWETCIAFHGHPCPVLATGYRASVEALRILHITDLHREKLACIAENQVCGVDAVQIMLNCTLAKVILSFGIMENRSILSFAFRMEKLSV